MEAKKCDMCKKFFDITELRNEIQSKKEQQIEEL